jgi:heme exporter protein A
MSAQHLAFDAVACLRGGRLLFEGLSFAVAPGAALIVEGPNGAGKTSLLRIAAGLLRAAAGRVSRPDRIGFLGHELGLDLDQPLGDALGFWAKIDGANGARVARAVDAMKLSPLAAVPVRMLSSGQRRRAGLARVIAGGAPLWLLDEPGVGLDTASLDALALAIESHRAGGGAVMATSHMPLGIARPQRLVVGG